MRFLHDHTRRPMRQSWCLLALLTLPLLAGCGGGGGGSNGNSGTGTTTTGTGTAGTNTGTQQPLTVTVTTATGLTASLSEPTSTVAVNGSLIYTLTLTNNTAAAIPVHSNGLNTPAAGLIVKNAAGVITFQPIPGTPPIANGSLAPGQSLTTTVSANGFTAAGAYTATATFDDDTTVAASVGPLAVTAQ